MRKRLPAVILTIVLLIQAFSVFSYSRYISTNNTANIINGNVAERPEDANKPFTMIWFTDSQYYAESYPMIFDFLGDWFVKEYRRGAFDYIINTGDIVNKASKTEQWEVADRNFRKLDRSNVPYGLVAGNHDVSINGLNYSMFGKYFGEARYKRNSWYGGSIDNNYCHYDLLSFGKHGFIILYLGYNTAYSQETVKWANNALEKHSDRTAVLALHEYLEHNGALTKTARNIYKNIVINNDNVALVLCGHNHGIKRNVKTITKSDGSSRKVLEILSDYQDAPHGGNGYLRYLHFYPSVGMLKVVTYSPYTNNFNFFKGNSDSFSESISLTH